MELEGRSRRNNISIDGIKKHNKEIWEECERRVRLILTEGLETENVEIDQDTVEYRKELWEHSCLPELQKYRLQG